MNKVAIFLFWVLISTGQSAKILGFFPVPSKSHYSLGHTLMRALALKGHEVTMISAIEDKNPVKNYRNIVLPAIMEEMQAKRKDVNFFELADMHPLVSIPFLAVFLADGGEVGLKDQQMQEFLAKNEKFDVVIVEQFFNDAHKALASHFNAPLILLSSVGANSWTNDKVGNPENPSFVPNFQLGYTGKMAFCERTLNTVIYGVTSLINHFYSYPRQNAAIQKYLPDPPQLNEVLYNASIVLLNSHSSMNDPVPLVPNMIEIGGFHVQEPKTLPIDLQQYLDEAKDGVIYFSMGSYLRSADLPPSTRDMFVRTFSKLKQKVIWKWEEDILPGKPANLRISSWWPQNDLLAHKNIKLFITHGGLLSTTEAIYHGVPVLAIPIFGDQKLNGQRAVRYGFGLSQPYHQLTEEKLTKAIDDLITNQTYKLNAKKRSMIFHDRESKPLDTAIYWVEYVVRHGGAPHLRVAALDLAWYEYLLLDVIGLFVIVGGVMVLVGFLVLKAIFKLCRTKNSKPKKEKKK